MAALALAENKAFENLPQINVDDFKNAVKDNCDKNGGEGTYDKVVSAGEEMKKFIEDHFDVDEIAKEIEKSGKAGEMDEVFKKYCDLRAKSIDQIHKVVETVTNCVDKEERAIFTRVLNITESLINFACDKDGERVALFIAEDGLKCMGDKAEELKKCGTDVVGDKLPTTFDKIPKLEVTKEGCDNYKKFQTCAVKSLATCEKDMPSEILDALFNYMYELSSCANLA